MSCFYKDEFSSISVPIFSISEKPTPDIHFLKIDKSKGTDIISNVAPEDKKISLNDFEGPSFEEVMEGVDSLLDHIWEIDTASMGKISLRSHEEIDSYPLLISKTPENFFAGVSTREYIDDCTKLGGEKISPSPIEYSYSNVKLVHTQKKDDIDLDNFATLNRIDVNKNNEGCSIEDFLKKLGYGVQNNKIEKTDCSVNGENSRTSHGNFFLTGVEKIKASLQPISQNNDFQNDDLISESNANSSDINTEDRNFPTLKTDNIDNIHKPKKIPQLSLSEELEDLSDSEYFGNWKDNKYIDSSNDKSEPFYNTIFYKNSPEILEKGPLPTKNRVDNEIGFHGLNLQKNPKMGYRNGTFRNYPEELIFSELCTEEYPYSDFQSLSSRLTSSYRINKRIISTAHYQRVDDEISYRKKNICRKGSLVFSKINKNDGKPEKVLFQRNLKISSEKFSENYFESIKSISTIVVALNNIYIGIKCIEYVKSKMEKVHDKVNGIKHFAFTLREVEEDLNLLKCCQVVLYIIFSKYNVVELDDPFIVKKGGSYHIDFRFPVNSSMAQNVITNRENLKRYIRETFKNSYFEYNGTENYKKGEISTIPILKYWNTSLNDLSQGIFLTDEYASALPVSLKNFEANDKILELFNDQKIIEKVLKILNNNFSFIAQNCPDKFLRYDSIFGECEGDFSEKISEEFSHISIRQSRNENQAIKVAIYTNLKQAPLVHTETKTDFSKSILDSEDKNGNVLGRTLLEVSINFTDDYDYFFENIFGFRNHSASLFNGCYDILECIRSVYDEIINNEGTNTYQEVSEKQKNFKPIQSYPLNSNRNVLSEIDLKKEAEFSVKFNHNDFTHFVPVLSKIMSVKTGKPASGNDQLEFTFPRFGNKSVVELVIKKCPEYILSQGAIKWVLMKPNSSYVPGINVSEFFVFASMNPIGENHFKKYEDMDEKEYISLTGLCEKNPEMLKKYYPFPILYNSFKVEEEMGVLVEFDNEIPFNHIYIMIMGSKVFDWETESTDCISCKKSFYIRSPWKATSRMPIIHFGNSNSKI
ncbi:hypothetical protein AYI68_g31 [Smittium mucronatum]|uniref:Uncharacterized protein n=1 Tax=Smittium mucronatum TaxID=133383 RepID=A0A1R0H9I9_9FUNG|nr:hypothetical protein AYI68_g31 [Smittium mucronatum]